MAEDELTDVVTDEWLLRHGITVDRSVRPPVFRCPPEATATIVVSGCGRVTHAALADTTVLGYLVEREIIDPFHADYGKTFLDMKRAFSSKVSPTFNRLYYAAEFLNASPGDLESVYFRAVRTLGPKFEGLVLYSLSERRTDDSEELAYRQRGLFEEAFDMLVAAIEEARRFVEEEKRKEGRRPHDQRGE